MARKALLIGTSQYSGGLKNLVSPPNDVTALAELLGNPDIGNFKVEAKYDPSSLELGKAIENWYRSHTKDDFVLLFLAGHGVKDIDRQLYFAASDTEIFEERLTTTTAIASTSLNNWMKRSKAKRQIVILNCCFSGAFAEHDTMDGGNIDLEESIASEEVILEGRVVMTSTSSIDYALERSHSNSGLSTYGYHLVEGLRTGASADSHEITIEGLHEYVSQKVREETGSSMSPKFFARGESCQLTIATVSLGDPDIQYRRRVERMVEEDGGEIEEYLSRPILNDLQIRLGLDKVIATQIENEVLAPIREYRSKLQEYRKYVENGILGKSILTSLACVRFKERQEGLGIAKDDARKILEQELNISEADSRKVLENTLNIPLELKIKENTDRESLNPQLGEVRESIDSIELLSAREIDYKPLHSLLKSQKWEEADRETDRIILLIVNKEECDILTLDDVNEFPVEDLRSIDRLWIVASNEHFGFSVQNKIWQECGSPRPHTKEWDKFCRQIGWKKYGWLKQSSNYIDYGDLRRSSSLSLKGEIPWYGKFEEAYLFFRQDL
jgi:hypothetical protein